MEFVDPFSSSPTLNLYAYSCDSTGLPLANVSSLQLASVPNTVDLPDAWRWDENSRAFCFSKVGHLSAALWLESTTSPPTATLTNMCALNGQLVGITSISIDASTVHDPVGPSMWLLTGMAVLSLRGQSLTTISSERTDGVLGRDLHAVLDLFSR
jgi:hypothetical protein